MYSPLSHRVFVVIYDTDYEHFVYIYDTSTGSDTTTQLPQSTSHHLKMMMSAMRSMISINSENSEAVEVKLGQYMSAPIHLLLRSRIATTHRDLSTPA